MKRWIIPLIAAFALTFGIISVLRSQPRREANTPPVQPPASAFEHNVAAVGLVETSTENIAIGSHLPGVVERVFVIVGDPVKAGAPLFKIDDRNLRAQLIQAEAAEQAAEARISVASASLDDLRLQLKFAEDVTDPRANQCRRGDSSPFCGPDGEGKAERGGGRSRHREGADRDGQDRTAAQCSDFPDCRRGPAGEDPCRRIRRRRRDLHADDLAGPRETSLSAGGR
jgi:hypothetical protein